MSVPKLRFKEFDGDNYANVKLGDISDIKTGPFGSALHQHDYVDTGTPIITVEHLSEQGITYQNLPKVSEADKKRLKSYILNQGDLVFSRVGSVDRCSIVSSKEDGWLFSGRLLRIKFKNTVHPNYVNFIFQDERVKYRIRSAAVGQTMPSLNTEILKGFEVFISLDKNEQTKIANFLTTIDDYINQLTRKHALLTQYKKAAMQQIFSQQLRFKDENGEDFADWEEVKLGGLCKITTGKLDANAMVEGGSYRFYTCAKDFYHIDKYAFDTNALLISGNGANVGYIHHFNGKFNAYQRTYVLDGFDDNIFYVKFYLDLKLSARIATEKKDGNTPYIVMGTLTDMPIFLPCIAEQTKIANFLTQLDQQLDQLQQQIDKVKQYKQGLLQQMFV